MRGVRHLRFALFLLVGVVVAGAPLLHNHPLVNEATEHAQSILAASTAPCSACAVGTARAIVTPPALIVPDTAPRAFIAPPSFFSTREAVLSLSSRAPPVA
jgi:hypothetical protein